MLLLDWALAPHAGPAALPRGRPARSPPQPAPGVLSHLPSPPAHRTRRPSTPLAPGRAEPPDPPPRRPLPQDPGMGGPLPHGSAATPRRTHPPPGSAPPACACRLDPVLGRRPLPGRSPSPDCSLPGLTPCSPVFLGSSVTFRRSASSGSPRSLTQTKATQVPEWPTPCRSRFSLLQLSPLQCRR